MEQELVCESGCGCACEQEQQIPLGLEDFVGLFKDPTNKDNFSKFPEFMDLLFPYNYSAYKAIEEYVNIHNKMHTEFPVRIEILENNGGEGQGDYRNMVCRFTAFDPQGEVFWFPFYVNFHASYSSWEGTYYWQKSDEYEIVYPRISAKVEYTADCQFDNKYEMEEFGERLSLSKNKIRELSVNEQKRLLQKRSNQVGSFERELELIGLGENATEIDLVMRENILEIISVVSSQGHSGFSFSYLSSIMNKYFSKTQILSPLTGEDSEWMDISDYSDNPMYQNNRMSSVFKHINDDGKVECYWLDGTVFYTVETDSNGENYKNYFTNGKSRLLIESFPWYPPETQYVEVPKDHEEI